MKPTYQIKYWPWTGESVFCSSIPSLQLPARIKKKWSPMAVQSDGETAKMMNGVNDKSIISHVYLQ